MAAIKEAFDGSRGRYGARKVWHQLRRSGHDIARCTVERLMHTMGLQGVVRGKKVLTTNPDAAQQCPDDKVNRAFVADMPNQLRVSDFTDVSSWQGKRAARHPSSACVAARTLRAGRRHRVITPNINANIHAVGGALPVAMHVVSRN